jgi:hypothetical protein
VDVHPSGEEHLGPCSAYSLLPLWEKVAKRRMRGSLSEQACRDRVLAVSDDPKPNALALDILQWATLARLRDDADELAAAVRENQKLLPILGLDATERERPLMGLLLQARDRERQLRFDPSPASLLWYSSHQHSLADTLAASTKGWVRA